MERFNPIVVFMYFALTSGIAMLCMNPIMQTIALVGAALLFLIRRAGRRGGHLPMLAFALLACVINPIFSHNGATVLFFVNGNPFTLEAVIYGAVCGVMLLAMLYWFRSFSALMTSDKILYLLGRISPKIALTVSMALRYVPLFSAQMRKTAQAQRAMGAIRADDSLSRIRGGARVFSVTLTWALENGIVTADAMEARGYGEGRRTSFAIYRFHRRDAALTAVILLLGGGIYYGVFGGFAAYQYYPIVTVRQDTAALLTYGAYALLTALPSTIDAGEIIRWKYLQSKI